MIIGIVSDSHDNLDAVREAVEILKENGVERILHAGDIVAPFAAKVFLEVGVPVDAVFGNNDGEKTKLTELLPGIALGARKLRLEGKAVVLVHDRKKLPARELELAEVLVHGHTHEAEVKRDGRRLEINPGEVGGWLTGKKTLAIWNTESELPEIVDFS